MTLPSIQLTNAALAMLGQYSIGAFDEGTELAQSCNLIVADTLRQVLTLHPWRCTLAKRRLARLAEAPDSEWTYAHALPAEMITLRALRTSAAPGAAPLLEYEVWGNRALSHRLDLWADIQQETDPATWPPYLIALARAALAAELAVAVGAGTTAAELFHRKAYGMPSEAMAGGLLAIARRADSQQQPPQAISDFPLAAARFGSP